MFHNKEKNKRSNSSSFHVANECEGLSNNPDELVPTDGEGEDSNYETNPFKMHVNTRTTSEYNNMNLLSSGNSYNNAEFNEILEMENNMDKLVEENNENDEDMINLKEDNPNTYINSNHGKSSNNYSNNEDENYKEILEYKVRKQAERLCELQEYKSLCEKRIRQLSPGHPLPILESHIANSSVSSKAEEVKFNNALQSQKFKINDLMNKLVSKENEFNNLFKKYDNLEKKHNNYLAESIPKSLIKNYNISQMISTVPQNENLFPYVDRIPSEKIKEAYSKLHSSFKQLMKDKEQILNSLRQETIINDEQRNYIEILKQTVECSLVKHGLLPLIEKQKNLYYKGKPHVNNVDLLIDISHIKNESDKYKKDFMLAEYKIDELKNELHLFNETNEEMTSKKEKIKENLEKGILELEEAKGRVNSLELEKDYLSEELNELKEYNDKVLKDYEISVEKNNFYEKEIEELREQLNHQNVLENKLSEYRSNFEKLGLDLENLLIEKEALDQKYKDLEDAYRETVDVNKNLNDEYENLKNNFYQLDNSLKLTEEKLLSSVKLNEKLNSKNDELNNYLKSTEQKLLSSANLNERFNSKNDELNNSLKSVEEKLLSSANLNEKLNTKNDELNYSIKSIEEKLLSSTNLNEKLNSKNEELNYSLKSVEEKLLSTIKLNEKLNNKNDELNSNLNNSLKLLSETEKKFKNLEIEYSKTKKESEDNINKLKESVSACEIKLKESHSCYEIKLNESHSTNETLVRDKDALINDIKMQKSDNLKLLNENDKFRFDSTELSNNFNKLLQQYELLNKNYKNIENLFNVTKIDKDNLLKDMTIYKEKTGIEDSMKQKEINRLNSLFNTFRSEKTEMESKLSSENGRLKEELDKMNSSRNESEIIMKREFNNLKLKYDEMLEAKNFTEIDFMEKEKYIKSLEQEIQKKSSIKNCPGLDNIYHEVKLAIHSCLSVASVFMKKYKKTYSKDLDESYANFDIGNDYQAVIESLHNLEDWLAVVCKEMEGYIFMPNENAKGSYNYKDSFNQLSDDYNNLFKSHEKTSKELKSFKNDNKKLYDQTKKFYEENIKTSLVIQENKFYVSLLKNILRSHPYKEISKYYSDVINFNDGIINFENEKIKLVRRIDNLERELSKCKKNPNVELEKTLSNEISNLKISMSDLEKKINEKKEKIYLVENEIKMFDEKINSYTNMNVFKANYLDKNSSIVTNLEYDSRKLYRNSELIKQSEMNDNNSFSYSSLMQENNSHINNFRRQNENQNKII